MNILVTGIASDIGYNCGRILRQLLGIHRLHGCDIHDDHAGLFVFDACVIAPRAAADNYQSWLADYVSQHRIDVVIPSSEAEIAALADADISARLEVPVMMLGAPLLKRTLDKHACLKFLATRDIACPANGLVGSDSPDSWPVIVKPRSGQGSKGLMLIESAEEFHRAAPVGYVWQEQLLPASEEYTCPVYRSKHAGMRILILRRVLQGGLTSKGEVVTNKTIRRYVAEIAEALDLEGAMNVQLRLTEKGPLLFEINPRLSSTVMFRHQLGFRDLEWWLMELTGGGVGDYQPVPSGTRFYRGSQEYIVAPQPTAG